MEMYAVTIKMVSPDDLDLIIIPIFIFYLLMLFREAGANPSSKAWVTPWIILWSLM